MTFSSDLIYDVLREHEPDHVLLRATYADAGTGLLDIARLGRYAGARREADRDAAAGPGVASGGAGAAGDFARNGGAGEMDEDILREKEDALIADAMRVD